ADGLSVKNPAETVRRGLDTLALSSRRLSRGEPLQELAPAPHHGPVAAASAGHVPPALSIRAQSLQSSQPYYVRAGVVNRQTYRSGMGRMHLLLASHLFMFSATFFGTFWL